MLKMIFGLEHIILNRCAIINWLRDYVYMKSRSGHCRKVRSSSTLRSTCLQYSSFRNVSLTGPCSSILRCASLSIGYASNDLLFPVQPLRMGDYNGSFREGKNITDKFIYNIMPIGFSDFIMRKYIAKQNPKKWC